MLTRDKVDKLYTLHRDELLAEYGAKTINLTAAAKELGLDPRTVLNMAGIPLLRVGKAYRVRVDSLARWMAEREVVEG